MNTTELIKKYNSYRTDKIDSASSEIQNILQKEGLLYSECIFVLEAVKHDILAQFFKEK